MKTLKPGSFGHRGLIGKKVVAKEANRVSAKCAIRAEAEEPAKKKSTDPNALTKSQTAKPTHAPSQQGH
jgi:hypothetical protein